MFVIEYACWFHIDRDDAQRSSLSLKTRMPEKYLLGIDGPGVEAPVTLPCCIRHTLPVPGVPGSGAVQMNPVSASLLSDAGGGLYVLPHSMSGGPLVCTVQRQKPIWQFIEGQSSFVSQRRPL